MATRNANIEAKLSELRNSSTASMDTDEVLKVVEDIIFTLGQKKENKDLEIVEYMQTLMMTIENLRNDISGLNPGGDATMAELPSVKDELDAISKHTEEATNKIMDVTEEIQTLSSGIEDQELQNNITNKTIEIFEQCNFQDISGQRIDKVIKTVQVIEATLEKMTNALGIKYKPIKVESGQKEDQGDEALLEGPQLDGQGNSQDDIDAILASFD